MFEPKVVESLLLYVPFYPKGTQVKLSDGRDGIIVENSGTRNLRPLLRLLDGTMLDLQEHENFKITILHETNEQVLDPVVGEADRKKMLTPSRRYRIMVIDNMLVHLQSMRGFLHNLYDLELLTSPDQALLCLKRQAEPDLIILSMDIPRVNGIELIGKIHDIVGDMVPVLSVINTNDKSLVARCRKAGAAGYIVRPYKPTFVKAEIKRILLKQQVTH